MYRDNKDIWPRNQKFILHVWKTREWDNFVKLLSNSLGPLKTDPFKLIISKGWYLNDDDEEQCKSFRQCYKRNTDIMTAGINDDDSGEKTEAIKNVNERPIEVEKQADDGSATSTRFHIFGAEASLWETHPEMIPDAYKRMAAISERMWNKKMQTKVGGILKKEKKVDEYMSLLNGML